MNTIQSTFAVAAASLALSSMASAALTLHVDSSDKTFYFTGLDAATSATDGRVGWGASFVADDTISYNQTIALSVQNSTFNGLGFIRTRESGTPPFSISFDVVDNSTFVSFNGRGSANSVSYSFLDAAGKAAFESAIGNTYVQNYGTGAADLTVVAAVPEPTSAALLGLGAFGFLIRRRR